VENIRLNCRGIFRGNHSDEFELKKNKRLFVNRRLHQLLGLRLRFCLRGKYSDIFNSIFQINFVDLFWPVPAAATECKRHTL